MTHVLHQDALSVPRGSNRLTQELLAQQSSATKDTTLIVIITDVTPALPPITALFVLTRILAMNVKMATTWTKVHASNAILSAQLARDQIIMNAQVAIPASFWIQWDYRRLLGDAKNALQVAKNVEKTLKIVKI